MHSEVVFLHNIHHQEQNYRLGIQIIAPRDCYNVVLITRVNNSTQRCLAVIQLFHVLLSKYSITVFPPKNVYSPDHNRHYKEHCSV